MCVCVCVGRVGDEAERQTQTQLPPSSSEETNSRSEISAKK